ncbi:hypothetical protein, partial [Sinorhizobium meliloti]|uniref:hypothetical protein n=1 Tax=Rhizobium meliloti TaxID=382 RepID=UPI001AEDFD7A
RGRVLTRVRPVMPLWQCRRPVWEALPLSEEAAWPYGAEEKLSDVEKRFDILNARSETYSSEALEQAGTFMFLLLRSASDRARLCAGSASLRRPRPHLRRLKFSRQRGKAQGTEHQPFRRA